MSYTTLGLNGVSRLAYHFLLFIKGKNLIEHFLDLSVSNNSKDLIDHLLECSFTTDELIEWITALAVNGVLSSETTLSIISSKEVILEFTLQNVFADTITVLEFNLLLDIDLDDIVEHNLTMSLPDALLWIANHRGTSWIALRDDSTTVWTANSRATIWTARRD